MSWELCGAVIGGGSLMLLTWKKTGGSHMGWGWGEGGGWGDEEGWAKAAAAGWPGRREEPQLTQTLVPLVETESSCGASALLSAPSFDPTPQLIGSQSQKRPLEVSWSSSVIYKRELRDPGRRCSCDGAAPCL